MSCAECYAVVTNHSQAAPSDVTRHASLAWCNTAAPAAECKFKFIIFVSYRSLSWHAPRDQSSGPGTCRGRRSSECGSKKF